MKLRHHNSRTRRGVTIIEVLIASSVMLGVTVTLAGFSRFSQVAWRSGVSDTSTTTATTLGLQRLGPSIRAARAVDIGQSSSTRLTLQLPEYNSSGNLVIPMQDGDVISYYLSNSTGSTAVSGNILWRSVNGTPDRAWSMAGNRGRVELASGGLAFSYFPVDDPETVTVLVTAAGTTGRASSDFSTSQEMVLRNKGL